MDNVKRHVAHECCQPDEIVEKLSSAWAQHPIIGPMYGPAYLVGRQTVSRAIEEYGNLAVAKIGFHLQGQADIGTFQAKVDRLEKE